MDRLTPFVKWAGGKTQLLEKLHEKMPEIYNRYYEPFIGGGALFLSLKPKNAVINDVNSQLLNVYRQLKNDAENVIRILKSYDDCECDRMHYEEMRTMYNNMIENNQLTSECAAMTIWINKHCFNGLYRVNKKGLFNVPYNNKNSGKSMDEENLRKIGEFLNESNAEILEGDFEKACETVEIGDFVYFDSPYVPVNETANFTDYTKDGFTYEDHKRLSELFKSLDKKGVKIMLSNHDVQLVHDLYAGYNIENISVRRHINSDASKRTGKEVIITNYRK